MKKIFSKSEFAAERKVSRAMVTKWIGLGLPVTADGRINRHDATEWLKANTARPEAQSETYSAARARKESSLADIRAIECARLRGEVVEIAAAVEILGESISICRSRLLAIPKAAAPELAQESDVGVVQEMLKAHIFDALKELASGEAITDKAVKATQKDAQHD